MYKCKELDREFTTQRDMFLAIVKSKGSIIESKMKAKKSVNVKSYPLNATVKGLPAKDGVFYAVINTTRYIDSHNDTHLDGIWSKTLNETRGELYYLADHIKSIDTIIAYPENVKAYTKHLFLTDLGLAKQGDTQALIFEINIKDMVHAKAREAVENNRPVQNSVNMQYVKMSLGVNSSDKDFKEEKKVWDKNYSKIINKDVVDEIGYTWFVQEAKIIDEGSMVVFGSNNMTPIITESKEVEPSLDTQQLKDIFKPLHAEVLNEVEQGKSLFKDILTTKN